MQDWYRDEYGARERNMKHYQKKSFLGMYCALNLKTNAREQEYKSRRNFEEERVERQDTKIYTILKLGRKCFTQSSKNQVQNLDTLNSRNQSG